MKNLYVVFGGTFNPIHYGHIFSAKNLSKEISIRKIILLPNNLQDTKTVSIIDKLHMIKLATKNDKLFEISYLETQKNKIFYTTETLKKIRQKIGIFQPLCFIIGLDQFYNLNSWKNWKNLLHLTHLLVLPRISNKKMNNSIKEWMKKNVTENITLLHQKPYGLIFFSNIPMINISSSQIRKNYYENKKCHKLLPHSVEKYIRKNNLYSKK